MKSYWNGSYVRNFSYRWPDTERWNGSISLVDSGLILREKGELDILLCALDQDLLTLSALMLADLLPVGVFCDRLQEEHGKMVEGFCRHLREWERHYLAS